MSILIGAIGGIIIGWCLAEGRTLKYKNIYFLIGVIGAVMIIVAQHL